MNPGRMRHRLIFQVTTETQTQSGEITTSWGTLGTVWGSVNDISGKEVMQSDNDIADVSTRIRCRYLPGVTAECRIVAGRRTFDIVHLNDIDGKRAEYEILCRTAEDNV